MAYMSQEKKKKIAAALKDAGLPKSFKYTLSVDNRTELVLTIREAPATVFDDFIAHVDCFGNNKLHANEKNALEAFEESGHFGINLFHTEKQFTGRTLKVINKMHETIKTAGEWFDKSDSMSDYFHTAFYIDIRFGRWDKPCVFTGKRRAKTAVREDVPVIEAKCVDTVLPAGVTVIAQGNRESSPATFEPEPKRDFMHVMATPEGWARVGEIERSNVVVDVPHGLGKSNVVPLFVREQRDPTEAEKREIARAELVRRGVVRMKATPAGSTLNDASLVALAEAMLDAVID